MPKTMVRIPPISRAIRRIGTPMRVGMNHFQLRENQLFRGIAEGSGAGT
jgi:hypothetical protein